MKTPPEQNVRVSQNILTRDTFGIPLYRILNRPVYKPKSNNTKLQLSDMFSKYVRDGSWMTVMTIINHTRHHAIQGFGLGHYIFVFCLREACDTKWECHQCDNCSPYVYLFANVALIAEMTYWHLSETDDYLFDIYKTTIRFI